MIDLDALKAELATSPWWIDGGMTNRDLDAAMAIIARHVQPAAPAPDRAALVETVEEAIRVASRADGATFRDITEAALAAVEAEGWGPRPEPITEGEKDALGLLFDGRVAMIPRNRPTVDAVLAALPERHRRLVLGVPSE